MKKLLYLAIGVAIGVSISFGPTTYAAVKQFILTEFNRPVVVNGVVYKDAQNPILNYNGKTYIPLAKIGDLTGVAYTWNAIKNQVEINSSAGNGVSGYIIDDGKVKSIEGAIAEEEAIKKFQEENKVVVQEDFGLTNENGTTVLYVHDRYGTKKRLTDSDDIDFVLAKIKKEKLPPSISEGWLSEKLLVNLYDNEVLNKSFDKVESKKFNESNYYKINDLIKTGIIT